MKVRELHELTARMMVSGDGDKEVRIGDQVESGPYLHASVGGVFQGYEGAIILTADDDDVWHDETNRSPQGGELPCLWKPS